MRRWCAGVTLAACLTIAAPVCLARQVGRQEVVLAENDGLKAVVHVQSPATLGDTDWLQIEILNSGPAGRVKAARLEAPSEHDGVVNSSDLDGVTLGIATGQNARSSVGNTIPAGRYLTSTPGIFAGAVYGLAKSDVHYTMRVALTLELEDGRSLIAQATGVPLSFTWAPPNATRIEALRKQAVDLLERAIPTATALSRPELAMFRALMRWEETSRNVTLDLALAALERRQIEGSFRFDEVMGLVFGRWKTDPAVIAFYRDALRTRGPEAISDLSLFASSVWDESLLEPVVLLIEAAARNPVNSLTLSRGVAFLDRNHPAWSQNASIPPRLSAAVREVHGALNGRSGTAGAFYNFADLLAMTHDRAMIWFLRTYLNDSTIDQFTTLSSNMPHGVTPMRHSEIAANGISRLLGEPVMFDPWKRERAPSGGPYPEWTEWDKRLRALEQRLDAMPKR